MKKIKINSIISLVIVLTICSFLMVACNNIKKNTDGKEDITEKVEIENDNVDVDNKDTLLIDDIKTITYKIKAKEPIVYNLDANGIAGFDDWKDFTVVNYELADIRNLNYVINDKRIRNMNYRMANLSNTIPSWLKSEEVLEDVTDVQNTYLELIKDEGIAEDEKKNKLVELSKKFDNLKKELDNTVQKYVEIHQDAIEEFNEELESGKIEDAIKEYNEEIKKMDKIVEKE